MLRKIATIKVPKGAGPREVKTKNVFATYDKQSAAFEFFFSDNVNVEDATADVLFIIDGQKVFMEDGAALGGTNETHTFIYPLPDKLLNYVGKVDGYLYLNLADGSRSDEIHFTFSIKKSQIDEEMEDAPDVYIKSFEEIKADVQSKADQAKKDMQDNVDQVISDYKTWKEQQEAKQDKFENSTDKKVSNITERVGEAENKASDLKKHLDVGQKNYFSTKTWINKPDFTVTNSGIPAIKIKLTGNEEYTLSSNIEPRTDGAANIFLTYGNRTTVSSSPDGVYPDQPKTLTTQSDGYVIVAIRDNIDVTNNDLWIMLNKGEEAYRWVPHTDDIVTKRYIDNLYETEVLYDGMSNGYGIYFEPGQSFDIDPDRTVEKLIFWWSRHEPGEDTRNYAFTNTIVDGDMLRMLQSQNSEMRVLLKPIESRGPTFKKINFTQSGVVGDSKNTDTFDLDNKLMVLRRLTVTYRNE